MQQIKNKTESHTLYLVATPIGNLMDISERAKKVLSEVDFVACEDTRNSAKLLSLYGIKKELVSYHEHNKHESGERIVARLLSGQSCAVITDAGMPAISDPGEDIVKLCADAGIRVSVIPGASAAVSALAVSALPTGKFCFEGFLPHKSSDRQKRLDALSREERTVIYYEAPHRLLKTLGDMKDTLGDTRRIALCRELTKINEEIIRTTVGQAYDYFSENEPRGEFVLVVEGAQPTDEENPLTDLTPEEHVKHYEAMGLRRMDAIKAAAKDRGLSKSDFYKIINS